MGLVSALLGDLHRLNHCRVTSNDRIATQRYSSPEIPIGYRVMSRTTSAPSGRRSRKMVAKGLCKVKKNSKNNLEVGGWVQVPFGFFLKNWKIVQK